MHRPGEKEGVRFTSQRHPGLNSVVNVNPLDRRDETMIDVDLSTSHVSPGLGGELNVCRKSDAFRLYFLVFVENSADVDRSSVKDKAGVK